MRTYNQSIAPSLMKRVFFPGGFIDNICRSQEALYCSVGVHNQRGKAEYSIWFLSQILWVKMLFASTSCPKSANW